MNDCAEIVENLVKLDNFFIFTLGDHKLALPLKSVEKVFPVVHITPLPGTPSHVIGVVNVRGTLLVVVDLRIKLGFPLKPIKLSDKLVLTNTRFRQIALLSESPTEVEQLDVAHIDTAIALNNDEPTLRGISLQPDGIILIHDLTEIFSDNEDRFLTSLLARRK